MSGRNGHKRSSGRIESRHSRNAILMPQTLNLRLGVYNACIVDAVALLPPPRCRDGKASRRAISA